MMKAALLILPMLFTATSADMADLSWKPEVGSTQKYKFNISSVMDMGGQPGEINVSMVLTDKIKSITEGVVTTDQTMSDFKLLMNGEDFAPPGQTPQDGEKTVVKTKLTGEIVSISSSNAEMQQPPRVVRMNTFYRPEKPVEVGKDWFVELKEDKIKGLPEAKAKYTVKGGETVNGHDCWRVAFVYSEMTGSAPMGSIGDVWLSKKNGSLVKMKADTENVVWAEGVPPMNSHVEINLVK